MNWKAGAFIGFTAALGGIGFTPTAFVVVALATILFAALTAE